MPVERSLTLSGEVPKTKLPSSLIKALTHKNPKGASSPIVSERAKCP